MRLVKGFTAALCGVLLWGVSGADAVILKIATLSPDGTVWMEKMRAGGKEVSEKTNGEVQFKFYPGGVMGDDQAVLRKMRLGQLQGGAVVSGSMTEAFSDTQVYCLPFVFDSFEQIDYVRSRMDPVIAEGLLQNGYVVLGMAGGGFAYVMSQEPVESIGDLKRRKLWGPESDQTSLAMIQAFGINPIPLSLADVRAGLQTGLIDTVVTSPVGAIALQWHTQIKTITDVPLLYVYGVLMVDRAAFEKLSPANQAVVREVMGRVFKEIEQQNLQDNDKALSAIRKQGIDFLTVSAPVMAEWREKGATVAAYLVGKKRLSQSILDTLEKTLAEYNTRHPDAGK